MGDRNDPSHGLVVFDPRVVDTTFLEAQGAASTSSSFSQAGSKPGAVTRVTGQALVPRISGEQGTDVEFTAVQGGYAGTASLLYSIDGGTTYRGWDRPRVARRWEPMVWTDSSTWDVSDAVTIPSTQEIVVVYGNRGGGNIKSATYDPSTRAWTGNGNITNASTYHAAGITVDPTTERVIVVAANSDLELETYTSEDAGSTWKLVADDTQDTDLPAAVSRCRVTYIHDALAIVLQQNGGTNVYQYASPDHGNTLTYIGTSSTVGYEVDIVPTEGGALVIYVENSSTNTHYRPISNVYDNLSDVTETELDGGVTLAQDLGGFRDFDGVLYLCSRGSSFTDFVYIWTSTDDGQTWSRQTAFANLGTNSYPTNLTMCSTMGEVSIISNHVASPGNEDGSLSRIVLSEFTNVEVPDSVSHSWVPYDLPDDSSGTKWTQNGAIAGTIESDGMMEISTATGQAGWYRYDSAAVSNENVVRFSVQIDSNSSNAALNNLSATLISGDGADEYEAQLRFDSTTGVDLYDLHGSTSIATATIDMTSEVEFVMWNPTEGEISCWYRPADGTVDWTEIATGETLTGDGVGSANWAFQLGRRTLGASVSRWRYVTLWAGSGSRVATVAGDLNGKTLTGLPYPVEGVGTSQGAGFVSVRGGPGFRAETYEIPTAYDYGIDAALPAVSPSPSAQWRSTDTTEQVIVWDLGDESSIGDALALYIDGANFRTAYLESYNGSTWDTHGTWDSADGASSLTYAMSGEMIYPGTTGTDAGYFPAEEFKDGVALLPSSKSRTIASQCAGTWGPTASATTIRPLFRLQHVDGTEATSGSVTLCRPRGLLVAYPTSRQIDRYWRVRIPSQDTATSDFRAGVIGLGRMIPLPPWAWGWSQRDTPSFESTTSRRGTERRTKTGEAVRRWAFGWPDGHQITPLRSTSDLDYYGVSGGLPLSSTDDVWMQLRGVIQGTESWTLPVVACSALPTSSGMVTDPTLFLYGDLSGSVQASLVVGEEGSSELIRVETISVDGVV